MAKQKVTGRPSIFVREWFADYLWDLFCPGCQTPVVARIVAEALDELEIGDKALMVGCVGCGGILIGGFDLDRVSPAHGRGPDVATALKRIYPGSIVFTVQGDGDCIAIGSSALVGALTRAEKITIIMVNNTNFGTTGGQLGPTTIVGQVTTTSPEGRKPESEGYPAHAAELAATFKGVAYSARGSLHTPASYQKTKGYIKTAFQRQIDNVGTSFVEVLTACPTNWHLSPVKSLEYIAEKIIPEFPLGEFRNVSHIE
ncbi:MAG: 2-oxoglutarate oxidoreductase [Dehalococcoidia bacterium]|nr:2-oxoglutarate oxidoreductase [Dehalococcoidia bacterium]